MQSWQEQNLIKLNAASAVRGRMRKTQRGRWKEREIYMIPVLEEFIIYSKGLQNTALGQIQANSGFGIFKRLFNRKIKEHATENVHGYKSLHY